MRVGEGEEEGRDSKAGTGCALSCPLTCDSIRTTQWTGIHGGQRPFKGARFLWNKLLITSTVPWTTYFLGMNFFYSLIEKVA
jgi:hypothetical protein